MLIGIAGKAGSGKDTAASYLCARHGFVTVAFATKLKQLLADLFGLTREQLYGNLKEVDDPRYGLSPRVMMQHFGQSMRALWPDIWVQHLRQQLETMLAVGMRVAVTDVRQANEAQMIRELGGYLVKVERPGAGARNGIPNHETESWVDKGSAWDLVITNDASLEKLYQQVETFYQQVKGND